jgi:prevent-host-death family protein
MVDNKRITMKLSTSVKPISYLKAHASRLIRELSTTPGTLVVTHNGQAKAVVQDIRTFERTQETLALLKILTRSQQSVRQGRVKSLDEAFGSLDRRVREWKNENI